MEKEEAGQIITYGWDALDRLKKVERVAPDDSEGLRRLYSHDPLGRLICFDTEKWDGSSWSVSAPHEQYVYAGLDMLQKRGLENTDIYRSYYPESFIPERAVGITTTGAILGAFWN